MGIVNTSKSIFQKMTGQEETPTPETAGGMPEEQRPQEDGPDDESSEGDPDREGNTDPQTNQPPFDPEAVRREAMIAASNKILAESMQQAAADVAPQTQPAKPVIVHSFKYLTIGVDKGMFHITGVDSLGEAFTVTEPAPPNLTAMGVVEYLEGIAATR